MSGAVLAGGGSGRGRFWPGAVLAGGGSGRGGWPGAVLAGGGSGRGRFWPGAVLAGGGSGRGRFWPGAVLAGGGSGRGRFWPGAVLAGGGSGRGRFWPGAVLAGGGSGRGRFWPGAVLAGGGSGRGRFWPGAVLAGGGSGRGRFWPGAVLAGGGSGRGRFWPGAVLAGGGSGRGRFWPGAVLAGGGSGRGRFWPGVTSRSVGGQKGWWYLVEECVRGRCDRASRVGGSFFGECAGGSLTRVVTSESETLLRDWQEQELVLLSAWWDAVAERAAAGSRRDEMVARREKEKDRIVGMTRRQRQWAEHHLRMGQQVVDPAGRRRVIRLKYRQRSLTQCDSRWAPRISAAQAELDLAVAGLRDVAAAAVAVWPGDTSEQWTGLSVRRLRGLARRLSG